MTAASDLQQAVLTGDAAAAVSAANAALAAGAEPMSLVTQCIAPAMREAGELFEQGDYFVPELLMAARATKGVFEILRPLLAKQGVEPVGRVVLGTVDGDLHDIGKNLVAAMLEGGGFEVIDLGVSVKPDQFVSAAEQRQADIVGLSALLTTTMPAMKTALAALKSSPRVDKMKIMVGGAPVTQAFASSIGADGYAENASAAVSVARQLIGK
ncbi:MAG: corrinoid protein [Myxococcales bacterium]